MLLKIRTLVLLIIIGVLAILSFSSPHNETPFHLDGPALIFAKETLPAEIINREANKTHLTSVHLPEQLETQEDEYIVHCDERSLLEDEAVFAARQLFFQSLVNSNQVDKQLDYALFALAPDDRSQLDLLVSFNQRYPNNPTALLESVRLCSTQLDNKHCDQNLIDMAIAADGNNGAMWLEIVYFHANRNNDQQTIFAIQELLKAPYFNEHFGRNVQRYSKALAGSRFNDFNLNTVAAIGIEAAKSIGFSGLFEWCKQGINRSEKVHACLQLGIDIKERGQRHMTKTFGLAIQRMIYQAEDNLESSAEIDRELNMAGSYSEQHQKAATLMFFDEELLRFWLNNSDDYGETEAANLLIEEAILRSKNENYLPCDS
ncbi:hypothetical protein [Thalassotalea sp. ND16A]|uniref:hypothetical protein n=1 Tax=Thalassotalea sp. ND16A TaxID=1535422 RepID=UPI00051A1E25|nr:hypothetical protein [Thalassotalea sp. ND16A]KGK00344.1 hypothetical protein ND16A_3551 [Thalassotalea sp. ND16A]